MQIKKFSRVFSDRVLSIADNEVGKKFIDHNYLNFFLNHPNASGIVAIENNEVAGFSFFQWCTSDELIRYILKGKVWIRYYLNNQKLITPGNHLIGYRNLTAVNYKFQGKGIGGKLVDCSVRELRKKSTVIVNVLWKSDSKKNLANKLIQSGLNPVKIIPDYWQKDSIKRNYECALCGKPPCKCSAQIFISRKKLD